MSSEGLIEILSRTHITRDALKGKTALVTGAGGGIGFQTARALCWMGAYVIIAEIDKQAGKQAELLLNQEFIEPKVAFISTDVGSQASVRGLARRVRRMGRTLDILINNAAIAPLGEVIDTPIETWDASYRVNLRGPVMLIQHFLPDMLERNTGVIINVSSTGTGFMGAYETFKSAQVHLTETLDAELEGTGVIALTIGPGLVPTQTATESIKRLAPQMGISLDDFYQMNQQAMVSVEEAGAGFAAAVTLAEEFRGQEISARQALLAAGYEEKTTETSLQKRYLSKDQQRLASTLAESVFETFSEQTGAWQERSVFERQWMLRDFRKNAGMPVDAWRALLSHLVESLNKGQSLPSVPLEDLITYYQHLADLAKGYTKDPEKLQENLAHIRQWQSEVQQLAEVLEGKASS